MTAPPLLHVPHSYVSICIERVSAPRDYQRGFFLPLLNRFLSFFLAFIVILAAKLPFILILNKHDLCQALSLSNVITLKKLKSLKICGYTPSFGVDSSKRAFMKQICNIVPFLLLLMGLSVFFSCKKSTVDQPAGPYTLSYGDSIIYLKPSAGDYIVTPVETRPGTYTGFPEGIQIDETTGAINVSKSETGLRYLVTHTDAAGKETTTKIVLSGITFRDKYYNLSVNDSIAFPVYNANESTSLPLTGSVFDDGGGAKLSGCDVKTINGQINLAQSIRDGLFGNNPVDDSKKEIDIVYRLNDGSDKALNKLRVKLYYYSSMSNVAPDLLETLQDRQDQGVFLRGASVMGFTRIAKPRPPCITIIAR